jgi:hypothetical protein
MATDVMFTRVSPENATVTGASEALFPTSEDPAFVAIGQYEADAPAEPAHPGLRRRA